MTSITSTSMKAGRDRSRTGVPTGMGPCGMFTPSSSTIITQLGRGHRMTRVVAVAAFAEIGGCFAFSAWRALADTGDDFARGPSPGR